MPALLPVVKNLSEVFNHKKLYRVTLQASRNTEGQPYTRSVQNTTLKRLMDHCEKKTVEDQIEFTRFTLADMRPTAVTDRMEDGDTNIIDATGHSDGRMVAKVY